MKIQNKKSKGSSNLRKVLILLLCFVMIIVMFLPYLAFFLDK